MRNPLKLIEKTAEGFDFSTLLPVSATNATAEPYLMALAQSLRPKNQTQGLKIQSQELKNQAQALCGHSTAVIAWQEVLKKSEKSEKP